MKSNIFVGVDYSLSCPAITVHVGDTWSYSNCQFFFLIAKKKSIIVDPQYKGTLQQDFLSSEERFDNISNWAISHIPKDVVVFLEGYSFGSSLGKKDSLYENTGLLKHKLYKRNQKCELLAPTIIKKYATLKGNSDKIAMELAFRQETGIDLPLKFDSKSGTSPSSDIIDSYFIAKYGFTNQNNFGIIS